MSTKKEDELHPVLRSDDLSRLSEATIGCHLITADC